MDGRVIAFSVSRARSRQGRGLARVGEANDSRWEMKSTACSPAEHPEILFGPENPWHFSEELRQRRRSALCIDMCSFVITSETPQWLRPRLTPTSTQWFSLPQQLRMLPSVSRVRANYSSQVTWLQHLVFRSSNRFRRRRKKQKTDGINFLSVF